jgi:hypothetical protein
MLQEQEQKYGQEFGCRTSLAEIQDELLMLCLALSGRAGGPGRTGGLSLARAGRADFLPAYLSRAIELGTEERAGVVD